MNYLSLKNAIFYPNQIVILKKRGKVLIDIIDIERIDYEKPSLKNYLFSSVWFGGTFPGRLEIYLKDNILTQKKYYTKTFLIRIKYKDYHNLPEIYKQKFNLY